MPVGLPGMRASIEPSYHAGNFLAEGAGVTVGRFVWGGTTATQVKTTGAGLPVGLVTRELTHFNPDLQSEGTLTVAAGENVTVAKTGRYFAVAGAAAVVGNKVFSVLADGTLKFGAAGAAVTGGLAGTIETPWAVLTAGAAGDLILIESC
jgi:hypothetical protein